MQEGQSPLNADRGQNLFTTSTHTGHHWRPGYYHPSSNFKSVLLEPIPKALNRKDEITPEVHFETTNKVLHDNKFPNQDVYNDPLSMRHTKPLPSYKVNYMYDLVEKLNSKPRRPLTMGFQTSEYKNEYENHESELAYVNDRPIHEVNYFYEDEQERKLTENAYDGNIKPAVPPIKPVDPSQIGVLNLLDPYLTTYNKNHKKFTNDELKNQAKNDAMTIHNTRGKLENLNSNVTNNMRDPMWFKSETVLRQVHQPLKTVPHGGMTTEARDRYVVPSDVKAKETKLCPIVNPFLLPEQSSKTVFATPDMYKTEYTNIGLGKPIKQNF